MKIISNTLFLKFICRNVFKKNLTTFRACSVLLTMYRTCTEQPRVTAPGIYNSRIATRQQHCNI